MSNLDQLINEIAHPKTGQAMRHDPTEYTHTGGTRWLAQQARKELSELREQVKELKAALADAIECNLLDDSVAGALRQKYAGLLQDGGGHE